ncbi:MAG: hypothetical protein IJ751_09615 [Oscillospiraceae bacterium]|nr:hypothetical protein [Oscillospiraceae bacterium]
MRPAKRIAVCGLTVALATVFLLLGGVIGVGTYIMPLLAGFLLLPAGRAYGWKYHLLLWIAASILTLLLTPDLEEGLMFLCFFGWYPAARPGLERLGQPWRWAAKLLAFNAALAVAEGVLYFLTVGEGTEGLWLLVVFWVLMNVVFLLYDTLVPRAEQLYERRLKSALHLDR